MSDLISRQAAIDVAYKYKADIIAEEIEDLPSAQPRWIPCSERLPEFEGKYLVTDEAGGITDILVDDFFQYDDGTWGWMYSQNVIAWMPLPEPYKEG